MACESHLAEQYGGDSVLEPGNWLIGDSVLEPGNWVIAEISGFVDMRLFTQKQRNEKIPKIWLPISW